MKMLFVTALLVSLVFAGFAGASEHRSGKDIYTAKCAMCHDSGVAGAPKVGDKAAWKHLIAEGMDDLVETAKKGKGAMPPMGMCNDCSMDELKEAVAYMVEQSK